MELIDKNLTEQISVVLNKKSRIVITTHQNPDGDAIGSIMALFGVLKKMGHNVTPITPNEFPEFLRWLPSTDIIIDYSKNKKKSDLIIDEADIIFHLDYNDIRRSAEMKDALLASKAIKVMIDHHPFPQLEVDFPISVVEASSTCELTYEFVEAIQQTTLIDSDIASCIYTGIMTDTGCFSYSSSRPRTFEVVAQLLRFGIDKDAISRRVFDSYSVNRMRFLGFCLNEKMKVYPQYKSAYMSISLSEQESFNFSTGDAEGFVNYPLSIKGINFTAFFTEKKDKIKISFRSRGGFAANEFSAKHFDGGGHRSAAGGESKLSLAQTIQKFEDLLVQYEKDLQL